MSDWLESEEFYNAMQGYRFAPRDDQRETVAHFESVKRLIRDAETNRMRYAIATAYGYLWCVNNEPGTPRQYTPERAAYEARKVLRELLTKEQRGQAINEALTKVHEAARCNCEGANGCDGSCAPYIGGIDA